MHGTHARPPDPPPARDGPLKGTLPRLASTRSHCGITPLSRAAAAEPVVCAICRAKRAGKRSRRSPRQRPPLPRPSGATSTLTRQSYRCDLTRSLGLVSFHGWPHVELPWPSPSWRPRTPVTRRSHICITRYRMRLARRVPHSSPRSPRHRGRIPPTADRSSRERRLHVRNSGTPRTSTGLRRRWR